MSTIGKYVIDSWAWVEYLIGTEAGMKVKEIMDKNEIFASVVTVAEVASKFQREGLDPEEAFTAIASKAKIIPVQARFACDAGILHARIKKSSTNFSLADAFALQTAKSLNAKVLTGDPDFEGIKEAEMLK